MIEKFGDDCRMEYAESIKGKKAELQIIILRNNEVGVPGLAASPLEASHDFLGCSSSLSSKYLLSIDYVASVLKRV